MNTSNNTCCSLNCFTPPEDQVDGLACDVCNSFGYCACKCVTHTFYLGEGKYYLEYNRLKSFKDWPPTKPSMAVLAKEGFYFTGELDICRCAFCNIEIGRWDEEDDVSANHDRWSPACRFLKNPELTKNVPLPPDVVASILE